MESDNEDQDLGESASNEILSISKNGLIPRSKRKKSVGICTQHCRYDVVRKGAYQHNLRDVGPDEDWTLYWTDYSILIENCLQLKSFQRINRFPGMAELCRKDILTDNLNRLLRIFPADYDFFPRSWSLPKERKDLLAYSEKFPYKTFILKPNTGCQGKGITLTRNIQQIPKLEKQTCQEYVARPFLIDGFKFDFRLYCLITSCFPLRIFVYNDGLVRFATTPYFEPRWENSTNMFMHLTNYAVNRNSKHYLVDDDIGTKRKISTLYRWFYSKSYDCSKIWKALDDIVVKTTIAAQPELKKLYQKCFPDHCHSKCCFQLLGYDILLDEQLKPFLLEVNHSPSFHVDSQVDQDVKERLLYDTFQILKVTRKDFPCGASCREGEQPCKSLKRQIEWEEKHKGNFRKIYPCRDSEKYDKLLLAAVEPQEHKKELENVEGGGEYLRLDLPDEDGNNNCSSNDSSEKEMNSTENNFLSESSNLIDLVLNELQKSRNLSYGELCEN